MATGYGVSSTSLNGCVLYFDAANPKSYPGAGTSIYDISGNNNTGTFTNGPLWGAANNGNISFDGTNDYISISSATNLLTFGTNNFSVSFWINLSSTSNQTILTNYNAYNSGFATYFFIGYYNSLAGIYILDSSGNTTNPTAVGASISQNTWTNFVFTRTGTTYYCYRNGIIINSQSDPDVNFSGSGRPILIGGGLADFGYMNGKISSFQVYNTALTAAQIKQNYDAIKDRFINTPFSPTDISGLKLWLDSDDSRTLFADTSGTTKATTDGTAVALWVDKSGNGNNISQSTVSARPAIKSSFTNGRNVLNFDGSNDTLIAPSSTATFKFLHSTGSSVFIVVQYKVTGTYTSYFTTATSSSNVGYVIYSPSDNSVYLPWMAGGVGGSLVVGNGSSSNYIDATQPYLICSISDPTNATAANRATGFKDGGAPFKNNISTLTASTANSTYDLAIGSEANTYYANVYIAEILAYNTILTASQRIQVETYLNNKWGLWNSFNPTSISGLQLWLDSSDSGTLFQDSAGVIPAINDGDPVGYWKDKSGNNRNFTQSTAANRPALKTNIQNSKNIIRFDGVNDFIQPSGYALGPQPVTVFTVFKTNGTGYHNIYDTSGSNPMMWIDGSGRIEFDITGYTSSSVVNIATLVSYVNASSGGIIAINGVTATSPYNVALSSSATTFFNRGGGQTYKGDFYEMLIYNSALSTAQRQQVETYLNQKWGVF